MPQPVEASFGCPHCWPEAAAAAWAARDALRRDATIVDDFHFRVSLLSCAACLQRFVSVFTETIAPGGDDPQHWEMMPVTPQEAAALAAGKDDDAIEAAVNALPARRCLVRDAPLGSQEYLYWSPALRVGMHD